jgi:Fe-S-cluster formation regulator IscX/YfhJ
MGTLSQLAEQLRAAHPAVDPRTVPADELARLIHDRNFDPSELSTGDVEVLRGLWYWEE